jgi:hypothetical protein
VRCPSPTNEAVNREQKSGVDWMIVRAKHTPRNENQRADGDCEALLGALTGYQKAFRGPRVAIGSKMTLMDPEKR